MIEEKRGWSLCSQQKFKFSETCNRCGSFKFEFGNGVYCDKGFYRPEQSVVTDGMVLTKTGYRWLQVIIVRPQDCIVAEKISMIEFGEKMIFEKEKIDINLLKDNKCQ